MRKTQSERIYEWLEEEAHVEFIDMPLPPKSFGYRPIPNKGGRGARIIPTKAYAEYKEQVESWLRLNFTPPDMMLVGMIMEHVWSVPKSYPAYYGQAMIDAWGEDPCPFTANKGDVHDNLNKAIPDAFMQLGWLDDDSQLFFCTSAKFVGHEDRVTVKLYYLHEQHSRIFHTHPKKR